MKILSNEDISDLEKITLAAEELTSIELIDNAADAISAEIMSRWLPGNRVLIFAGWGNNGADALATAAILAQQGYAPEIYLFNIHGNKLTPECRICRDRLLNTCAGSIKFLEITGKEPFTWPEIDADCLVIDGMFGSGLNGPLPRSFQLIVHNINQSGATVIAIDMPSGLMSEWNGAQSRENMIHASLTLALTAPRLSFLLAENAPAVGEWKVLDIGISHNALRDAPYTYYLVEKNTVSRFLPPRNTFSSKKDYGSALICAGSYGMFGAACLSATAALRAGAGKVTVMSASDGIPVLQSAVPCAMFRDGGKGRVINSIKDTDKYSSVAIGPGIGTDHATIDALESVLKAHNAASKPLILDADALNCIALRPLLLNYLPVLSILTPHAGEFDRIFGENATDEDRLRRAIEISRYHKVIIILKGRFTAIVRPDGKIFFNSSGTPAMATPGSGDVLTGIIAAFMAQGYKPEKAAFIATYVHGVAGELAASRQGEYGVTATDIADNIGRAIKNIQE
ncbi:MAG: NAD(P)H-hydrate dehydratase [Bacteroidales bacterium]|nr:NAD(P)H-hydrate dehydratase [Bacteroidales bacterium]